jgi:molybdopterin/thiamine biosynthesis adenylyltransferase
MNKIRGLKEVTAPRSPRNELVPPGARMPTLVGCKVNPEARLKTLRIAILGCGSVGMRIALHLARLGLAVLILVDPKMFKFESILTHEISPKEVGKEKALALAWRCKEIAPGTRIFYYVGNAQELPNDLWLDVDLVVLASDNLRAEVETGATTLALGLPLVHVSLLGDLLTTHVRFFSNRHPQSPCPACAFGATERALLNNEVRFSCDAGISGGDGVRVAAPATRSFSYLCSMAADLAVNSIMRFVLGLGESVEDQITEYCGYTDRIVTSKLEFNPECTSAHSRYEIVQAQQSLDTCALNELATAHLNAQSGALDFTLGQLVWVEQCVCGCASPQLFRRFLPLDQIRTAQCGECRKPISPSPFHTHRTVTASLLGDAINTPLRRLGATSVRYVLAQSSSKAVLIRNPQSERSIA